MSSASAKSRGESRGTRLRFPGVRAPKPLLPPHAERRLSARQLELLDELEEKLLREGLADLTMAEIAALLGCSLRTFYGIAPSKDELLLTVVDRRLHRIGRAAIETLDASMPPLDAFGRTCRPPTRRCSRKQWSCRPNSRRSQELAACSTPTKPT